MLKANHPPEKILFNKKEILIEKGQFITKQNRLSRELGIKSSTIQNKLQILENVGFLDIKTTNKFSIITIRNFGTYQEIKNSKDKQKINKRKTKKRQKGRTGFKKIGLWTTKDKQKENKNNKNNRNKGLACVYAIFRKLFSIKREEKKERKYTKKEDLYLKALNALNALKLDNTDKLDKKELSKKDLRLDKREISKKDSRLAKKEKETKQRKRKKKKEIPEKEIPERKIPERKKRKAKKKDSYLEFVFLTNEQYQKLIMIFGETGTERRIENLNNYAHQIGKIKFKNKYKSHYHTILNWDRMEKKRNGGLL